MATEAVFSCPTLLLGAGSRRSASRLIWQAMNHRASVYLKHQAQAYFWRRPQGALTHRLRNKSHGEVAEWAGLQQRQTGSGLTSDTTAELWWDVDQVIQTALHVHTLTHTHTHACGP